MSATSSDWLPRAWRAASAAWACVGDGLPRPCGSEQFLIPQAELDGLLDRAEQLLAVTKDEEGDDPLQVAMRNADCGRSSTVKHLIAARVGFLPVAFRREGDRLVASGTSVILDDLGERVPNFEIRRRDIGSANPDPKATSTIGALLEDRATGTTYEMHAERVVVCADSFRTPQLLFASGIRPARPWSLPERPPPAFGDGGARSGVPPPDPRQEQCKVGSMIIPFVDGVRPMHGQLISMAPLKGRLRIRRRACRHGHRRARDDYVVRLEGHQFQRRVEFSETRTDFSGMPAMTIRYTLTDIDRQTIELMRANTVRSAKVIGELVREPMLSPGGVSLHYQGTVRMGVLDDGESVCDPYGRVRVGHRSPLHRH